MTCVIATQVVLHNHERREHHMNIGDLQRVTDLAENQRAIPERGIAYGLRSVDNINVDTMVKFVRRQGDQLIARGICGNEFPVSGSSAFVLTPRSVARSR